MDLRHRREVETEARIGGDHDVDLAAQLARQHGPLHIATGELADERIRPARLDLVLADLAVRLRAEGASIEPPAASRERLAIELAKGEIVRDRHRGDAGVLQRLLRKTRDLALPHLCAR